MTYSIRTIIIVNRKNAINEQNARYKRFEIIQINTGRCPSKYTVPSKYTNEVFPSFQQIMS